jgi:hypothetical protein
VKRSASGASQGTTIVWRAAARSAKPHRELLDIQFSYLRS